MTRVKICGITRPADAEAAVDLGAWAVGLNHWEGSSRRIDPAVAAEIGQALKRRAEIVGVFVNPSLGEVADAAENAGLTMVQLHGEEGPSFCAEVARRTGAKVIKAVRVRSAADVRAAEAYRTDFHLLDSHVRDAQGGSGASFDWQLAAARHSKVPMILAGGLTPENVSEAVRVVRPYAIDVASGVESEPGVKDHERMRALFEAVQGAGLRGGVSVATPEKVEERFGPYGGRFVPETLIAALDELSAAWAEARADESFQKELLGPAARIRRPPDPALSGRTPLRAGRPHASI